MLLITQTLAPVSTATLQGRSVYSHITEKETEGQREHERKSGSGEVSQNLNTGLSTPSPGSAPPSCLAEVLWGLRTVLLAHYLTLSKTGMRLSASIPVAARETGRKGPASQAAGEETEASPRKGGSCPGH